MKTITVLISDDGSVSLDLNGFSGHGCEKVFEDFANGKKPTVMKEKREYYEQTSQKEKQGL